MPVSATGQVVQRLPIQVQGTTLTQLAPHLQLAVVVVMVVVCSIPCQLACLPAILKYLIAAYPHTVTPEAFIPGIMPLTYYVGSSIRRYV